MSVHVVQYSRLGVDALSIVKGVYLLVNGCTLITVFRAPGRGSRQLQLLPKLGGWNIDTLQVWHYNQHVNFPGEGVIRWSRECPQDRPECPQDGRLVDFAASHWLAAAGVHGTIFWRDIVESTPMVLANMQKVHVASVMSVHVLAPR